MLGEGAQFGEFQLERRIAIGGMAEIWSAKRAGDVLNRRYAIKILLDSFAKDPKLRAMFRDEANIAELLDHPNVVRVEGVIEENGYFGHVMELVDGRDVRRVLQAVIKSDAQVPIHHAIMIVRETARGLGYAHALTSAQGEPLGVIHRDVSPHNILVDREGRVRVVDFGVARAKNRVTVTSAGVVKGKLAYMSPEQLLGGDVTALADVWSLGVVLWEMLALRRLFGSATDADVVRLAVAGQIPVLDSSVRADVPPALSELVMRMLSIHAADRPQSMLEVETELTQIGRNYEKAFSTLVLAAWVSGYLEPPKRKTAMMPLVSLPIPQPPNNDTIKVAFDDSHRDIEEPRTLIDVDDPDPALAVPTEAVALPGMSPRLPMPKVIPAPAKTDPGRDLLDTQPDPMEPDLLPSGQDVARDELLKRTDQMAVTRVPSSGPMVRPMTPLLRAARMEEAMTPPTPLAVPREVLKPVPITFTSLQPDTPPKLSATPQKGPPPIRIEPAGKTTFAWVVSGLLFGIVGILLFGRACAVL